MSQVHEAGDELFQLFQKIVPPPNDRRGKKNIKQSKAQIGESLDRFYREAKVLRAKHRLGLIARARVVRHLQGRMIAGGYEADLVQRVIFSLILSAFIGRGT